MSLINRVLEDLERNRPAQLGEATGDLASTTRAVARRRPSLVVPISAAAVAGAAVALFVAAGPGARMFSTDYAQRQAAVAMPVSKPVAKPVAIATPAPAPAPAPAASVSIAAASTEAVAASAPRPTPVAIAKPPAKVETPPAAAVAASKPVVAVTALAAASVVPARAAHASASQMPVAAVPAVRTATASAPQVIAREEPPRAYTPPIKTVSPQQQSENLYREAVALLQQGRAAEAVDTLTKSLQVQPGNVAARKELASIWLQRANVERALSTLEEGRRIAPSDPELAIAVARLELERGNPQRAEDLLEQAASATQADPRSHAMHAVALQRLGRHDEAVAQFLLALQSNSGMPTWLVGLGISLRAIGKPTEAYEAFARARSTGLLSAELATFVDQQLQALAK
jgi:MSHA biogenesis protein MshN